MVGTGPDFIFFTKSDTAILRVIGSPAVSGKRRYGVGSVVTIGFHSAGNPERCCPGFTIIFSEGPDLPASTLTPP